MFVDPRLDDISALDDAKSNHLPDALSELQEGLQAWAPVLGLDFNDQLVELTAAITAPRREAPPADRAELLSRLLGVAVGACHVLDEQVGKAYFGGARTAVHALKKTLKRVFQETCIPY